MAKKSDSAQDDSSTKPIWVFLLIGLVLIFAGIFVDQSLWSTSLQKAEIITGTGLVAAAIAALLLV